MSPRSVIGFLVVCAAVLAPWVVRDWLPGTARPEVGFKKNDRKSREGEVRERRQFSEIPYRPRGEQKSKHIPNGVTKSIKTGAKSLFRSKQISAKLPQSPRSLAAAKLHTERLSRTMRRFGMNLGDPVYIRVFKEEHEMELWVQPRGRSNFALFKVYRIAECTGELGPKTREGDWQAPEGFYFVTPSRMNPETRYHLGFDLGYPNLYDRFHRRSGGNIMIHGKETSRGSYALTDHEIEEVYVIAEAALRDGQPFFRVHCFPFRMDDKQMDAKIAEHPEEDAFWANLKEGYDYFEIIRRPPNVKVTTDGKYHFL